MDASAYSSIVIQDPSQRADLNNRLYLNQPALSSAFRDAAQGREVVTPQLITQLTGKPSAVYRSHPGNPSDMFVQPTESFGNETKPIEDLIRRKIQNGSLSSADQSSLEASVQNLAQKTGLTKDHIKEQIGNFEYELRHPPHDDMDSKTAARLQAMGIDVKPHEVHLDGIIDDEVAKARNGPSQFLPMATSESHVVSAVQGSDARSIYTNAGFNENDLPPRPPLGTPEQREFLTAVHESAHASYMATSRSPDGRAQVDDGLHLPASTSVDVRTQWGEVTGDLAIARLNDPEFSALQENYLRERHVSTFAISALNGISAHDTATAVRVFQATGQQIDLEKFDAEKVRLGDRIRENLDHRQLTTNNLMSAVGEILQNDQTEQDPSKRLSAVQRAEAQSFVEDARALGYTANPDYKNAPRQQTNDGPAKPQPQPSASSPTGPN